MKTIGTSLLAMTYFAILICFSGTVFGLVAGVAFGVFRYLTGLPA